YRHQRVRLEPARGQCRLRRSALCISDSGSSLFGAPCLGALGLFSGCCGASSLGLGNSGLCFGCSARLGVRRGGLGGSGSRFLGGSRLGGQTLFFLPRGSLCCQTLLFGLGCRGLLGCPRSGGSLLGGARLGLCSKTLLFGLGGGFGSQT